jgi:hypothetical protein
VQGAVLADDSVVEAAVIGLAPVVAQAGRDVGTPRAGRLRRADEGVETREGLVEAELSRLNEGGRTEQSAAGRGRTSIVAEGTIR